MISVDTEAFVSQWLIFKDITDMNTNEVVNQLYDRLDITKKDTKNLLDKIQECLVDQLDEGHRFTLPGLGTFNTHTRESHTSYNPYYQSYMNIPPKRVIDFTASQDLKSYIESES